MTFEELRNQIRTGNLAPVYLLHGQEGYYLDELVKEFEQVLPEADREFNQYVLYAPQILPGQVIDICNGFPMMGDRQMVILKECQSVRADLINKLYTYVEHPSPTTTLVIVFRGEKAKGKELMSVAKKKAVVFESAKVWENQLQPLIAKLITNRGLSYDHKALQMLADFVGTDLSRLYNEVEKLATILGPGATVTPEAVERNIGISKEFNNFELIDALAVRDVGKAMRIAEYFASNPKANPLVMTTAALYNFFSDLLVIIYTKDKSDQGLVAALKLKSSFALKRYKPAMRNYNAYQLIEIIWALRQFDVRSKGGGSRQNEHDLFHDLIFHILTAPGNLGV